MATITFTASASDLQRLVDATCNIGLYNPALNGTKADFTKQYWLRRMLSAVRSYDLRITQQAAVDAYLLANPVVEPNIT
jgi:hypothetical protein